MLSLVLQWMRMFSQCPSGLSIFDHNSALPWPSVSVFLYLKWYSDDFIVTCGIISTGNIKKCGPSCCWAKLHTASDSNSFVPMSNMRITPKLKGGKRKENPERWHKDLTGLCLWMNRGRTSELWDAAGKTCTCSCSLSWKVMVFVMGSIKHPNTQKPDRN